jgi:hypothetical protein
MTAARRGLVLKISVSTALTVGTLWLLVATTDFSVADLTGRALRPGSLLLAVLAYGWVQVSRALRFASIHRELRGSPLSRWLQVALIHGALNQVLPFRTGEASYPVLMRRIHGATLGRSVLVLLVARIFDLLVVFLFALAFVPVVGPRLGVAPGLAAGVCAAVVAGCLLALVALRPALRLGFSLARRYGRGRLGERLCERLGRLVAEAAMFHDLSHFLSVFALSASMWIGLYVTYFGLLNGFGFPIDLPATVIGSIGAILTGVLPVNGVANVGTLQVGWTLGLVLVGFAEAEALAAGIWAHVGVIALALGYGLVGYLWLQSKAPAARSRR